MNQEFGFEILPFEIAPEFQGEMFEEEIDLERGRSFAGGASKSFRPRSPSKPYPKGNKRPQFPKPKVVSKGYGRPWDIIQEPNDLAGDKPESSDSERVRWIQDCLNQTMSLQLRVTGIMNAETRSAVRNFQKQQGLRVSGIVSPKTEQTLSAICEGKQNKEAEFWNVLPINSELEQEFVIKQPCKITYQLKYKNINAVVNKNGKPVANPSLPREQGVYVIKLAGNPYYVGVAVNNSGVKARFDDRVKAIRDFGGIDIKTVEGTNLSAVTVDVYTIVRGNKNTCLVTRRRKGDSSVQGQPIKNHAELLLLEQHLIDKLKTLGKGNQYFEQIDQTSKNNVIFDPPLPAR